MNARAHLPSGEDDLGELFSFQVRHFNVQYSRASALIYGADFGLTLNEWRALAELVAVGEPSMSMGRLVQETGFDYGLASRLIDALVNKKLVRRTVDPSDARSRMLTLTAKGRTLANEVLAVAQERHRRLMSELSPQDRATLHRLMNHLIERAGAMLEEEQARRRARTR